MPTIRVCDFETTGFEPPAKVIEVGLVDLTLLGEAWGVTEQLSWLCYATEIPPENRAVHHIRVEELAGQPPFGPLSVYQAAGGKEPDVIAAHNMAFEAQWLESPPHKPRLCTYKAALRVWPDAPSHGNFALAYWLEDQGRVTLHEIAGQQAHRAGPDAYATALILRELLKHATANEMVAWTKEPKLLPTCPIGKFRGKPWGDVEGGFLNWMLKQDDMEADLKWNARRELDRRMGR